MKCVVRKIKPGDPGYGSEESVLWPWLAERSDSGRGRAFPTHRQALHYAVTGQALRLSMAERRVIRSQQRPYWDRRRREASAAG